MAVNGFVAMVSLFPFVRCRGVKEFLCQFLAFFGELPSPAGAVPGADSVPVYAAGVSVTFEFDHAASQALWRIAAAECRGYCRQVLLGDWSLDQVEECDRVSLGDAVH